MEEVKEVEEVSERAVQILLGRDYVEKLEAEAKANDRTAGRHATWIVKRYFDGTLAPTLNGMVV